MIMTNKIFFKNLLGKNITNFKVKVKSRLKHYLFSRSRNTNINSREIVALLFCKAFSSK